MCLRNKTLKGDKRDLHLVVQKTCELRVYKKKKREKSIKCVALLYGLNIVETVLELWNASKLNIIFQVGPNH